jgi:cytosine/adenosine deaminase-related metal-dependent hydrolase
VAVGANVKFSGPAPRVVDASNSILIPGFVYCHRHSWEGVLRRIISNGDIANILAHRETTATPTTAWGLGAKRRLRI